MQVGKGVLEEGRGKVREVEEARRGREEGEAGNEARRAVREVSLEPEMGWSGKGQMSGSWGR